MGTMTSGTSRDGRQEAGRGRPGVLHPHLADGRQLDVRVDHLPGQGPNQRNSLMGGKEYDFIFHLS
jgi:hypothetical protein